MPYEAYIGYLDEQRDAMAAGEPIVVEVRDRDTFERKVVRALVSPEPDGIPGGDELWVVDWIENREAAPWSIRVLEELGEEASANRADIAQDDLQAMAEESRKYTGSRYKGSTLPDMLGQEEIRKYHEHVAGKRPPAGS